MNKQILFFCFIIFILLCVTYQNKLNKKTAGKKTYRVHNYHEEFLQFKKKHPNAFMLSKPQDTHKDFEKWEEEEGINYDGSQEEEYRFEIFREHTDKIDELNDEADGEFELSIDNEFGVMTKEEFVNNVLGDKNKELLGQQQQHKDNVDLEKGQEIPKKLSYAHLEKGVKSQGQCGSCWAFAAIGVIEMKFQPPHPLSEQELIDCVTENSGCDGGCQSKGLNYVLENGVSYEKDYPYKQKQGKCQENKENTKLLRQQSTHGQRSSKKFKVNAKQLHGMVDLEKPQCEEIKKQLIKGKGPIAVSVYAEGIIDEWQYYSKGILSHEENASWQKKDGKYMVDHAVVLVGYDTDYWIIKNSWGPNWGENGYIRIKMGDTFNICHESFYLGD